MNDFIKNYWERKSLWNYDYLKIPIERKRLEEIIKTIPDDVKTILDVGCGNGSFINFIKNKKIYNRLVGIDSSKEALKYVKTEKVNRNVATLPFKNNEFDLIICLEVLEHLSQQGFKDTIAEIQRVSKKYILITVPNSENLKNSLIPCPKCYCYFNPRFHLRNFDEKKLNHLFNKFKSIVIKKFGPVMEYKKYNKFMFSLYLTFKNFIPVKDTICPQCGHQEKIQNNKNKTTEKHSLRFNNIFKTMIKIFVPTEKKQRWLLALYVKNE